MKIAYFCILYIRKRMNWSAIAFDWNQVRAFLATAEEGSLSAAARALGQTQPTLGRQVTALEQALGVVLFERIGRSLQLTPSGLDLLEHVRAMGEAASRISLAASGRSQTIEGDVRITASDAMSAFVLPPILARLRREAPGIRVEVIASNALQDLRRREADIALRHVRPEQPELIARKLRDSEAYFYAARAYIEAHGNPASPGDIADHDLIGFDTTGQMQAHLNAMGFPVTKRNFPLVTDCGVAGWEMARRGLGLCIMMREVAEQFPEMERVLPQAAPIPVPVWLTTHRELHTSRRIRLVFDMLAQAMS